MSNKAREAFQRSKEFLKKCNGQGLVEYALILALIAVVVLLAVKGVGLTTQNVFTKINTSLGNP